MNKAEIIKNKLQNALNPDFLEVLDESYKHRGHLGYQGDTGSHFDVIILSDQFEGMIKIKRHRLIHSILAKELTDYIHALSIKAYTPKERPEYKVHPTSS